MLSPELRVGLRHICGVKQCSFKESEGLVILRELLDTPLRGVYPERSVRPEGFLRKGLLRRRVQNDMALQICRTLTPSLNIDTHLQYAYLFLRICSLLSIGTIQSERLKILFTSTHLTSFITEDLNLLRKHFFVEHLTTKGFGSIFRIVPAALKADVTFTWFASVYASVVVFVAKRMGNKSIIVVGGVDVAKYPEINYGIWLSWWKAMFVKYALRNASNVLVVDPSLQKSARLLAEYEGDNIECIPTGYDASEWFPSGEKEPFVLTVAGCETEERMRVKGIDFLFVAARAMPEVRFVVIGLSRHPIASIRIPSNVEVIPFVERRELLQYYQRAKVYCQPSYSEGLPSSLCEAMLCECIPVGTDVGGVPTAIGGNGFLVPYGDADKLCEAMRAAMQSPNEIGHTARKHIAETFTLQKREAALLRVIRGSVR